MEKVKIIANYLPQFHSIPENDTWWGKGYTDWTAVKKSKSLYKNHIQPKVPENNNYYDLSEVDSIRWQAKLAKENGIDGFSIYHYWFNSNMQLLQKPSELILENKDIDCDYCFIWDNATWKRTWSNVKYGNDWGSANIKNDSQNTEDGILAELIYGEEEDWLNHFDYLLPFFKDERYIKLNGKPIFGIFNQENDSEVLIKMFDYWDKLAIQNGLPGVEILGKRNNHKCRITEYEYEYEPLQHGWIRYNFCMKVYQKLRSTLLKKIEVVDKYDYDKIWRIIIKKAEKCNDEKRFFGGFVSYDDTPRRGKKGKVVVGASPEKFGRYMKKLVDISKKQDKEIVFVTAWNEWGEGAYLEPDTSTGMAYLQQIERLVK